MSKGAFIGDVAKQVGMNPKTIRYYEGLGLLSEPERTESGYRLYSEKDLERLQFIKGGKALGLSLTEIREILEAWNEGDSPCGHVSSLLDSKIQDLDRRIAEMTAFRDHLRAYKQDVDARPPAPNTPCRHIAGALSGEWHEELPEHGPFTGSR
ncbi:Mercuric resistance operon regulatory protein [compost metagenome]